MGPTWGPPGLSAPDGPHHGPWTLLREILLHTERTMWWFSSHHDDVIMSAMASQITSLTIVYSTVYSRRRSKKTSTLRVTGLCEGNSSVTGEFPAQRASNAENVSIWWRQHALMVPTTGNLTVSSPYMESILVSTMNQRWRGLFHHLSLIQTPNKVMAHKGRHTSWLGITP